MSEIATLMPLDIWIALFNKTDQPVGHNHDRGEILGVPVERRWIRSQAGGSGFGGTGGNGYEITHPQFKLTLLAGDLSETFKRKERERDYSTLMIPVLLNGDFEAYHRFQVLLKVAS